MHTVLHFRLLTLGPSTESMNVCNLKKNTKIIDNKQETA